MSDTTMSGASMGADAVTLRISSVGRLICASLLDSLIGVVTLGIGWLVWAAITAAEGQTPGKKLMRMRVVGKQDGQTVSWAKYVFLRGLVGQIILCIPLVGLVLFFMPLWDEFNQSVGAKISDTVVIDID